MALRILLIDDEEPFRALLESYLTERGYEVFQAGAGDSGIGMLDQCWPHLVVIDFLLPVKNGFVVAESVRNRPDGDRTPIVMISGVFKNPRTADEAKTKYRVLDFLSKPIDLPKFGQLVDDALRYEHSDDDVHAPTQRGLVNAGVAWGLHHGVYRWFDQARKSHTLTVTRAPLQNGTIEMEGATITCSLEELPTLLADEIRWVSGGGVPVSRTTEEATTRNREIGEAVTVHVDALEDGRASDVLAPFGGPERVGRLIDEERSRRS